VSIDTRLDRLMPALSGKERALLVLRNLKEGKPQDPMIARGMLPQEASEYNRLIRLMNACNGELVTLIVFVGQGIEKLSIRMGWLFTTAMWEIYAEDVDEYLDKYTKEPITESEFHALESKAQQSYAPVSELAYFLTSLKEDWSDDDLEDKEKYIVKPEVWEPVQRKHERELARLVAEGVLEAKDKGKSLRINRRSFHGWRDRDVPVVPDWGAGYEVRPDSEVEQVAKERDRRAAVRKGLAQILGEDDDDAPWWAQLSRKMPAAIRSSLESHWTELTTIEIVLEEVAGEFGGEDVLKPLLRQDIVDAKQRPATSTASCRSGRASSGCPRRNRKP
jgi:hypothetical protein